MKTSKRRANKKKKESSFGDVFIILAILSVIAILVGAGIYLFLNTEKKYSLDQDLCPKKGALATVAVLLDTTDQLAPVTKAQVTEEISTILKTIPRYYRLSIYTMNEEGLLQNPITTVCNPGSKGNFGDLERQGLTANPAMIDKKFTQFSDTVKQAVIEVFSEDLEAKKSPLLGSMQELSLELLHPMSWRELTSRYEIAYSEIPDFIKKINQFDDTQFADWVKGNYKIRPENFVSWVKENNGNLVSKNRIIFVTDLFEHTEVFSIYQSGLNFDQFKNSRATEKFGKKYLKTDLDFWIVRRNINGHKTIDLLNFWRKIITKEFGSHMNSITTLTGES